MKNNFIRCLWLGICISILSLLACLVHAEKVEEIFEAQKELEISSSEKTKERLAQQKLLEQTKDAIKMGNKEYQQACLLCHGIDGKGDGEYAFALNIKPADLTQIKKRNNNIFPFSKLYRIIDGRYEIKSHGTRIMPIWGERYSSESWLDTNPQNSETLARGRIFELLLYLETIQK